MSVPVSVALKRASEGRWSDMNLELLIALEVRGLLIHVLLAALGCIQHTSTYAIVGRGDVLARSILVRHSIF